MTSPTSIRPDVHLARFEDLATQRLYDLLRLRVDVFVVEQDCPYPELDGRDTEPDALHLWVEVDGVVASTLRVLHGLPDDPDCLVIGRVCTGTPHRGLGLSATLVRAALEHVGADARVRIGAQAHLEHWYARFGFVRSGPDYDEDGIRHLPMVREAGSSDGVPAAS